MHNALATLSLGVSVLVVTSSCMGAPLALSDTPDGVTCADFNIAAHLAWQHKLGDWTDANGTSQGQVPFAATTVPSLNRSQQIEWNVTALVREWIAHRDRPPAILLRVVPPGPAGTVSFYSREVDNERVRPRLDVTLDGGRSLRLNPIADASLDCSTYKGLGSGKSFSIGGTDHVAVLEFNLADIPAGASLVRATLTLTSTAKQYGPSRIGVMQLTIPSFDPSAGVPIQGIAWRYPGDAGLSKDPDVLVATTFDNWNWRGPWKGGGHIEVVDKDPAGRFEPLQGAALRIEVPKGDSFGADLRYQFKEQIGSEPEEIYFRYYLRFADDWRPTVGGKLPGIAGTYGKAGWGGRPSNGHDGWSMRGSFGPSPKTGNPLASFVPIGTYAYEAHSGQPWGEIWPWQIDSRGLLHRNQWYCIEQYVKLNTPGQRDGIVRAWVNGRPAFERTNVLMRDIAALKIENIWIDVWHGGTTPAMQNLDLYIDNIVIARKYVGPMRTARQLPH